jgi:ATP-binding cassette subfamily G (WHITE) protein 2
VEYSEEERMAKVDSVLDELGLTKVANTRVGDAYKRGVSGGERKRVSIALELVTDPVVLFLDEPTTGLDSHTALEVMGILRRLSRQGRIIMCSIHQPRADIFDLFDQVMVLAPTGKTVFFGPGTQHYCLCLSLFLSLSLPLPLPLPLFAFN